MYVHKPAFLTFYPCTLFSNMMVQLLYVHVVTCDWACNQIQISYDLVDTNVCTDAEAHFYMYTHKHAYKHMYIRYVHTYLIILSTVVYWLHGSCEHLIKERKRTVNI